MIATNFKNTQAKKLNEIVRFVRSMKNKGFDVLFNNKGVSGSRVGKRLYKVYKEPIYGRKAVYSREYFIQIGAIIFDKKTLIAVDEI